MKLRRRGRKIVALAAAYAVALQAILLAGAGAGALAAGARSSAWAICLSGKAAGSHRAPTGHGYDCLFACLAGCCAIAAAPPPAMPARYAPATTRKLAVAVEAARHLRLSLPRAHRSRAPPPLG